MRYVLVSHSDKKKKSRKIARRWMCALMIIVLLALSISVLVYRKSMTPTLLEIAEVKVQSEATEAINEAIVSVFDGVSYENLVTIEKNSQNEITLLSTNSGVANSLARTTSLLTQSKINALFQEKINVPIGTLSGVPLLSELGPFVSIQVSPIGTVNCFFYSQFESAGINQTLHRIFLSVESTVELIVPSMRKTLTIETPVMLCETVIVGKVPETFFQGSLF